MIESDRSDRGFAYQREFVLIREQINAWIGCLDSYLATKGLASIRREMCDYFLARNPLYRLASFYKLGCGGLSLDYDGRNIKASSLVDFFTSRFSDWRQVKPFGQFINHLEVLSFAEEGGLEGINLEISTLLSKFKGYSIYFDAEQIKNVSDKLNLILRSAIYLFPHVINAVEVRVRVNSALGEWLEKNLGDSNRNLYSIFCSLSNRKCAYNEVALHFPLPYTNLVPGLSHRLPSYIDRESIVFGSFFSRVCPDCQFRTVGLSFSPNHLINSRSLFLAKEIEGVCLTWVDKFTPWCVFDGEAKGYKLTERPNPIKYYLSFRGFRKFDYLSSSGVNLDESERKLMDLYWIPDDVSGLFQPTLENKSSRSGYSDSLFLARVGEDIILYEIPRQFLKAQFSMKGHITGLDVKTNKELQALKLCALIEESTSGGNILPFKMYQGGQVPKRLVQIPADLESFRIGI